MGGVPGEFAEVPEGVDIGVGGVGHGGFDEPWAWVQEEGQGVGDGEPDAPAGDVGDCCGDGVSWGAEGDGAVLREGGARGGGGGGVVGSFGIGLEEDEGVVVVDCLAGYVGVDGAGGGLVREGDVEGCCHFAGRGKVCSGCCDLSRWSEICTGKYG